MLDAPDNPIVILPTANHRYEVCAPVTTGRDAMLMYCAGRLGRQFRVVVDSKPQICTVGTIDRVHWLIEEVK